MTTATTPNRSLALADYLPLVAVALLCALFCLVQRSHHQADKSTGTQVMFTNVSTSSQTLAWAVRW